jgi:hypothetical protein
MTALRKPRLTARQRDLLWAIDAGEVRCDWPTRGEPYMRWKDHGVVTAAVKPLIHALWAELPPPPALGSFLPRPLRLTDAGREILRASA